MQYKVPYSKYPTLFFTITTAGFNYHSLDRTKLDIHINQERSTRDENGKIVTISDRYEFAECTDKDFNTDYEKNLYRKWKGYWSSMNWYCVFDPDDSLYTIGNSGSGTA